MRKLSLLLTLLFDNSSGWVLPINTMMTCLFMSDVISMSRLHPYETCPSQCPILKFWKESSSQRGKKMKKYQMMEEQMHLWWALCPISLSATKTMKDPYYFISMTNALDNIGQSQWPALFISCMCYTYVLIFIHPICGEIHLLIFQNGSYKQMIVFGYKIRSIISSTNCSLKYTF